MKEYFVEHGNEVDLDKLKSGFMEKNEYVAAHKGLPIICHDVFIAYEGGILMIIRDNEPMKGEMWCLGGRIKRGVKTEESLKENIKGECGLELKDIKYLGCARVFQRTEPFGHGKGTDCPVFVYFARGRGELKLDKLHKDPRIIKAEEYAGLREKLHPYIRDFMDKAMKLV